MNQENIRFLREDYLYENVHSHIIELSTGINLPNSILLYNLSKEIAIHSELVITFPQNYNYKF